MRNINLITVVAFSLLLGACGGASSTTGEQSVGAPGSNASADQVVSSSERFTQLSDHQEPATKTLTIKHHQIECEGFQVGHCFLVKEGSGPWTFFYDRIAGFDYQWGIESQIVVAANDGETAMMADEDAGYRLVTVLQSSEQHSSTSFDYVSRGGHGGIVRVGEQTFSLRGDKSFRCAPQDCDTIESLLSQQQSVLFRFSHALSVDEPLTLDAVMCADAPGSFFQSCGMPDYSAEADERFYQ